LYPRSHRSQGTLLLVRFSYGRRSRPSKRTTSGRRRPKGTATTTADPHVVDCVRFGHRPAIHISLRRQPMLQTSTFGLPTRPSKTKTPISGRDDAFLHEPGTPFSSQRSLARRAQALTRHGVHQPFPVEKEAYWTSHEET
jgi:hypothetical protein